MITELGRVPLKQTAIIQSVAQYGKMGIRLMELGFVPGSRVVPLFCGSPGSPIAYEIRGVVIALRRSESMKIWVSVCDDEKKGGKGHGGVLSS